jgi:hypothetical protein
MMKRILKTAGWIAAPKTMFAVTRPRKAAMLKATQVAAGALVSRLPFRRQRTSPLRVVARGLGAAALTVPIGLWAGRKMFSGGSTAE